MGLPPVIGIAGYARSGKDTVGRLLTKEFNFVRASFADGVREVALAVDPYIPVMPVRDPESVDGHGAFTRLSSVVATLGWEKAKNSPEVRRVLQAVGTDAVRNHLGNHVWIDSLERRLRHVIAGVNLVVTDVRFPNEAAWVRLRGGKVWRVNRPGFGPAGNHSSELHVDSIVQDWTVLNHGTLQDLYDRVRLDMQRLYGVLPAR